MQAASQHQAEPLTGDVALDGREPDAAALQVVLHPQVHLVVVPDHVGRQGHHVRVPEREAPHAVAPAPLAGDLVQQPVPRHRHLRALEQQGHGRETHRRRRAPRGHAEAGVERLFEREVGVVERREEGLGLFQELGFQGGVGVPEQEGELRAGIHHRLPGAGVVRRQHRRRDGQRLAADADADELDRIGHAVEVGERQGGLVHGRVVERQEREVAVAEQQHAGVVAVGDAVREAARAGLRHEGERAPVHAQQPGRRDAVRGRVVRGGHAAKRGPQRRRVADAEDVGGERAVRGGPVRVGQRHAALARGPVAGRRRRQVPGAALRGAAGHGGEGARGPRAERRAPGGARVRPAARRAEQPGELAAGVEHHGDVLRWRADGERHGEADVVMEPQLARRPRQRPRRHLPRPQREHARPRRGPRRLDRHGPRPRRCRREEDEEETGEQRGRHGGECDLRPGPMRACDARGAMRCVLVLDSRVGFRGRTRGGFYGWVARPDSSVHGAVHWSGGRLVTQRDGPGMGARSSRGETRDAALSPGRGTRSFACRLAGIATGERQLGL
jgi:hypothetical protein